LLLAIALGAFLHVDQIQVSAQQTPAADSSNQNAPRPAKPDEIDITPPAEPPASPITPSQPAVKIPHFTSCPIVELRQTVPELAHLKATQDQASLAGLLSRIGDKTVEIANKTPNLISYEVVVLEQSGLRTRQNFSYLVLPHARGSKSLVFDEFRVDIASGKKFLSEDIDKDSAPKSPTASSSLDLPSLRPPDLEPEAGPRSQGFVNDWLHFYPANRSESEFRYLGQQKMDGHHTLVVAFAQKPGSVRLPARVKFENKTISIFMQGVAWVDASDFTIVRLRTDLLSAPPQLPLRQLTADIHFAQVRIADFPSPLWLPSQVVVTTNVGGEIIRESHSYSDYHVFRTHSKIVLNP
jgi:hypothetical protein